MDSYKRFSEGKLLGKDNRLTSTGISDNDYSQTKKVWDCFGIKNFAEYQDVYQRCDVLLLMCSSSLVKSVWRIMATASTLHKFPCREQGRNAGTCRREA